MVGEDSHVSHGHDEVLIGVVDGNVLGCAGGRVFATQLADTGGVKTGGFEIGKDGGARAEFLGG